MYGLGVLNGLWVTIETLFGDATFATCPTYVKRAKVVPARHRARRTRRPAGAPSGGPLHPPVPGREVRHVRPVPRPAGPAARPGDRRYAMHGVRHVREGLSARRDLRLSREKAKAKSAGPPSMLYHLGRCIFCRLCVEACPFDAIELSREYELAMYRHDFVWRWTSSWRWATGAASSTLGEAWKAKRRKRRKKVAPAGAHARGAERMEPPCLSFSSLPAWSR